MRPRSDDSPRTAPIVTRLSAKGRVPRYSARNAFIGEMDAARVAGMIAATEGAGIPSDTAATRAPADPRTGRRRAAPRADGPRRPRAEARGQADDDAAERALQHHADHLAAIGAERHADADLVGALRDLIGGDAVQSDRGEHQRDDRQTIRPDSRPRAADRTSDRPAPAASGRW